MAGYGGRRGPNVSQYVAQLNAIPSAHDVAGQDEMPNIEDDLAQFTNAEFLDFDAQDFFPAQEKQGKQGSAQENNVDVKGLDFVNADFPFGDLNFLPTDQPATLTSPIQNPYTNIPDPGFGSTTSPVAFNPAPYPGQKHHISSPTTSTTSTPHNTTAAPGQPQEPGETSASRLAAEEDKRRRNTAASARFRVKKKQREQALEQTAKELEGKVTQLEQRIGQLETENEWLRGLVMEKHIGSKEDLKIRLKKGEGEGEGKGEGSEKERKSGEGKKGVGTEEEESK